MRLAISNETRFKIKKPLLKKVLLKAAKAQRISPQYEVSVALVNFQVIKSLNKKYRGKNKATTVLSFSYQGVRNEVFNKKSKILGEIILCPKVIFGKSSKNRLLRNRDKILAQYLVHGFLHLVGFNHQTKKEENAGKVLEQKILSHFF